ncbi:glycoside hydrolase family 2 TIM barrel-domain containing protein [Carboxylicivirga sp. N1Y90]|uniref:glycoside hydrolase family 2 TIM barrel-domain containing protein n=1 Tax=Carboxylicivirga fragile TaxID=3417571 RepID=UPI003D345AE3|nr:hypothetical protein [Marinilabiliaceae bacterium N1Y90]
MHKLLILVFLAVVSACINFSTPKIDIVSVVDRQVFVNQSPYIIKGICYHPVPLGSDVRSFNKLEEDLQLMKNAGINTIRVYSPIADRNVLNKVDSMGMKLIISFGFNQNGNYDILSGSFINYVREFKTHNAILFWELGNEYNYHPEWFEGDMKNWYRAMNDAAKLIHRTDAFHPVATAHGDLPDSLALSIGSAIDVWGMNVYRWDNPKQIFSEWEKISEKPMYLAEAGADSYMSIPKDGYQQGPNEKAQADATLAILKDIFAHQDICSGVCLFSFTDGWWKAGSNASIDPGGFAPESSGVPYDGTANEEYWGITKIDREPKDAYYVVEAIYSKGK